MALYSDTKEATLNADAGTVRSAVRWTSGTNIVAGVWLVAAPFILDYSNIAGAVWNDILVGVIVAILAWIRVGSPLLNEGVGWTNLVLGAWLILAPFVIGYSANTAALWNDVIIGFVVAVLAAMSAVSSQHFEPGTGPQPMTG